MILITIEGVPVYSTIKEALGWSKRNFDGEEVAHVHKLTSGFGYMGGTSDMGGTIEPPEPPPIEPPPPPPPPIEPPPPPPPPVPVVSDDVPFVSSDNGGDSGSSGSTY